MWYGLDQRGVEEVREGSRWWNGSLYALAEGRTGGGGMSAEEIYITFFVS